MWALRWSAGDERFDLSRHRRNVFTHTSHDPVDWTYRHLGNFLLNGTPAHFYDAG